VTDTPAFERLNLSRRGSTAVVALANGKVNALDREVLAELMTAVDFCERDPDIEALVMTGEGSVFSAGLDVSEVLAHDTSYASALLDDLCAVLVRIFRSPMPTVAAVNGPAIAGGCLLACAFDRRLVAEEARIGVTELKVGVSFPNVAVELLRHVAGARTEQLMLEARLLGAEEAQQVGLAHQVLPGSDLQAAAVSAAEQLASFDRSAYALAKESSRRFARSAMEDGAGRDLDGRVRDQWNAAPTRAGLERLVAPKG
jgi:enoyl-CoA hydratase